MQNGVLENTNYSFITRFEEVEKGINSEEFKTITKDAEQNFLISKVLNIPITSEVHFEF